MLSRRSRTSLVAGRRLVKNVLPIWIPREF
jgi:hypothetical protein